MTYVPVGPIRRELESHPFIPDGFSFAEDDEVLVTPWGDALPPVEFSRQQFDRLVEVSGKPQLNDGSDVILLATYLSSRAVFNDELGCWELPLKAAYDDKNRARYPLVTINALGYSKQLAHRASVEVFLGVPLPRNRARHIQIDHRCRNHACCNPYHLEPVSSGVNNERKEIARRRVKQPELFQLPSDPDAVITFGMLAVYAAENGTVDHSNGSSNGQSS